jgi:hypothetical protein
MMMRMRDEMTDAGRAAEWQARLMREDAERRVRVARIDLRARSRIYDAACSDRAAGAPVESRPEAPALVASYRSKP